MANLISPEERLQKRVNGLWVRQQPVAVPSIEEILQRNRNMVPYRIKQQQYEAARKNSLFFDYNDPTQINSFADVLYRNAQDGGNLLSVVTDTADLLYRGNIKPLLEGNFAAAGLNALTNFSETMDIVANPVKGYRQAGVEGFNQAIFERKNFDYDTGNLAGDMFQEIVSDPLTWLSLGSTALVKLSTEIGSAAMKATIKQAIPTISEKSTRKFVGQVMRAPAKKEISHTVDLISRFESGKYIDQLGTQGMLTFAQDVAKHKAGMRLAKAAYGIRSFGDTVDKALFHTAIGTGLGAAPYAIMGIGKPAYRYAVNQIIGRMTSAYKADNFIPLKDFLTDLPRQIITHGALQAAGELEHGLPTTILRREVSAFSELQSRQLKNIRKELAKKPDLTPEDLIGMYDSFARANKTANFDEYVQLVENLSQHETMGYYFRQLQYHVKQAKEFYRIRHDAIRYAPVKQSFDSAKRLRELMYNALQGKASILGRINKLMDFNPNKMARETRKQYTDGVLLLKQEFIETLSEFQYQIDWKYIDKVFEDIILGMGSVSYVKHNLNKIYLRDVGTSVAVLHDTLQQFKVAGLMIDAELDDMIYKLGEVQHLFQTGKPAAWDKFDAFYNDLEMFARPIERSFKKNETIEQILTRFEKSKGENLQKILDDGVFTKGSESIRPDLSESSQLAFKTVMKDIKLMVDQAHMISNSAIHEDMISSIKTQVDDVLSVFAAVSEDARLKIPSELLAETDELIAELRRMIFSLKKTTEMTPLGTLNIGTRFPKRLEEYRLYTGKSMVEELNKLVDNLDELRTQHVLPSVDLDDSKLYYNLIASKVSSDLSLMSNEALNNLLDDVKNMEQFGALLAHLQEIENIDIPGIPEAVDRVMYKLTALSAKRDIYAMILESHKLDDELKVALFDGLQSIARREVNDIYRSKEYWSREIVSQMEKHMMFIKEKESFKLEDLMDTGHQADDDAQAAYDLAMKEFPDLMAGHKNVIAYDLETTGKNRDGERLLQIGYSINGIKQPLISIKPDVNYVPEVKVMKKLLEGRYPEVKSMDNAALTELYFRHFDVDGAVTEEEAIRQFSGILELHQGLNSPLTLLTHNGVEFDNSFLRRRAARNGLVVDLNAVQFDVLEKLKDRAGHRRLSHDEKLEVNELFNAYLSAVYTSAEMKVQNEMIGPMPLTRTQKVKETYEFLPGVDRTLMHDISEIIDAFTPTRQITENGQRGAMIPAPITKFIPRAEVFEALNTGLRNTKDVIANGLSDIKNNNRMMRSIFIDRDAVKEVFGGNIMSTLGEHLIKDGKLTGFLTTGVKRAHDPDRTFQFFKRQDMSSPEGSRMTLLMNDPSASMARMRDMVDLPERIPQNMADAIAFMHAKVGTLGDLSAGRLNALLHQLVPEADIKTQFAQALYTFHRLEHLVEDSTAYNTFIKELQAAVGVDTVRVLQTPEMLRYTERDQPYLKDYHKFYEGSVTLGPDGVYEGYLNEALGMVDGVEKRMDVIRDLASLDQKHHVGSSLAKQELAVITPMYHLFTDFKALMEKVLKPYMTDDATFHTHEKIFKNLFQLQDNQRSIQVLSRKFSLSPEAFAAELYWLGKGRMTFLGADLYAQDGTKHLNDLSKYYNQVLQNRAEYEKLGVRFYNDNDRVVIYLSSDPAYRNAYKQFKYPKIQEDVRAFIVRLPKTHVFHKYDDEIASILKRFHEMKKMALHNHAESRGSMLELMSKDDYLKFDTQFQDIPDILPLSEFTGTHGLDGMNFNHSVLGTAHNRRRLLKYASVNPMKTLFSLQQQISVRVGTQTQYLSIMMDPIHGFDGPMFKGLTDEQLYETLKNHQEYKAAFLAEDPKRGYIVRHVIINSPKDVAFARSVNAVILPSEVYAKTMAIVNDFKITNGFINGLNRMVLQPAKLGLLLTEGFIIRNIVDSNIKNIATAESPGIVRHTLHTIRNYRKYTSIVKQILEMDKGWSRDNIDEFFSTADSATREFRDLFDLYNRFLNDAATGMSNELEQYYSDAALAMERRARQGYDGNPIVRAELIKEYLQTPEDVRRQLFNHLQEPQLDELDRLLSDQDYYKRAYQMHRNTRNTRLQLEDIVGYMKRPETLPEDLAKEFDRLYEKHGQAVSEDLLMHRMTSGVFTGFMRVNGDVERIVRLASYTHALEEGLSEHEAMYKVLKTHFDYQNKSEWQMYGEMVFPFSTFMLSNLMFWMEHMAKHPGQARMMESIMEPVFDLKDYSTWDLENRTTLQYQILSGNVVVDEQGTTMKLNPSVMDVVQILTQPDYLLGRVNMMARVPLQLMRLKQAEWESDEDFSRKKLQMLISIFPIAGVQLNRAWNAVDPKKDATPMVARMSGPLFNRTSIPQERAPYQPRPVFRKRQFPNQGSLPGKKKYFGFHKPSYKQLRMQSIPFAYSGVKWRGFQKPYATRVFSSIAKNPRTSNLRQGVNPKGEKLRHLLMWLPTDKYNLKFKLKWINKY